MSPTLGQNFALCANKADLSHVSRVQLEIGTERRGGARRREGTGEAEGKTERKINKEYIQMRAATDTTVSEWKLSTFHIGQSSRGMT